MLGWLTVLLPGIAQAQAPGDTAAIRHNIDQAFEQVKQRDSVYLDPELEQELKADYFNRITTLSPGSFANKDNAKFMIARYATAEGTEEILRDFLNSAGGTHDEIYFIGSWLYVKVYTNSSNALGYIRPDVPNQYATYLVQLEPETSGALIYLNGKAICPVAQAKNGIRVHSNKKYLVEIKAGGKTCCSNEIVFNKQERKLVKCAVKD
jgi:hypothetical protein